jgi:ribosomal protein S21
MSKINTSIIVNQEEQKVDEAFERMFKDFTKKVKKDGVLDEVKRRRYYMKPSEAKRLRKNGKPKRSLQKK